MNIKTIVVHLDATPHCLARVDLAIRIATAHGAHLVGLAPTGLPDVLATMSSAVPDGVEFIALSARFLRERADTVASDFIERARAAGIASHEARVVVDEPLDAIVWHANCSDLLVIGQTDGSASPDGVAWDFPQQAVLHAGCPVLVVPHAGHFPAVGERVLIAWKGTREAVRAVRDALPILRGAQRVVLISDFLGEDDALLRAARERITAGADVLAIHIAAREELDPPATAIIAVDPENAELERSLVSETREGYLAAFAAWRSELARAWREAGAAFFEVPADEAADHAVRRIASPASTGSAQARGA